MEHTFGIQISKWQENVIGIDQNGEPFEVPARWDERGNTYFFLHGDRWYAKEFLTKKQQLPILRVLELSTAHITKESNEFLRYEAHTCGPVQLIVFEKGEYGYLIRVEDHEIEDQVPEDIKSLLEFAESQNCTWMILDRDGEVLESLPRWEW